MSDHELTLDDAIAGAHAILDRALTHIAADGKHLTGVCVLISGGHDSTVLAHLMRTRVTHPVHINTGIGIEQTRQFVRAACHHLDLPLIEEHPPDSYDDLVPGKVLTHTGTSALRPVWRGFPGPAGHPFIYARLTERPLRTVRARFVNHPRRERVIFLSGMRRAESVRRASNAAEIDRQGSIVWVCPIIDWTRRHIADYQRRFHPPRNEVADLLHMSGECLCGAFARPGELDEIAFWFPQTATRIRTLETQARHAGIPTCRWGHRPPSPRAA